MNRNAKKIKKFVIHVPNCSKAGSQKWGNDVKVWAKKTWATAPEFEQRKEAMAPEFGQMDRAMAPELGK